MIIKSLEINPFSLIDHNDLQRINIKCNVSRDCHLFLNVTEKGAVIIDRHPISLCSGDCSADVMLKAPERDIDSIWSIVDGDGNALAETSVIWKAPRKWELYVMVSTHTDIGLHNSQYIQRHNSVLFTEKAMELCDKTENENNFGKYHYIMEGTWFFNNYVADRGEEKAKNLVENYIKTGKIGVCAGVAGNHTQVYGLEEMCRSSYGRRKLKNKWDIDVKTMTMIDNNGLSWAIVQPYVDAGIENIIFAPNQWNPLPSTIWKCDTDKVAAWWTPDAGGGGTRIDIRYTSNLPMLFYWSNKERDKKILVWGSTQYNHGGDAFGFDPVVPYSENYMKKIENCMARQLALMESKMPYDIWLFESYCDDQEPSYHLTETIKKWNEKWKYPKIKTFGNPDEPFEKIRNKYKDIIPVVSGDITGGWYQHPLSAPDLLAEKSAADRLLPTAEKFSVIAALADNEYKYPATEFERAWDYLIFNDEHSYGTSGYQGRRVYETWMQHRDWIQKAQETARNELNNAMNTISKRIKADEDSIVVFNPTLQRRSELVKHEDSAYYVTDVPPLGYKTVPKNVFVTEKSQVECDSAPTIENGFYRVTFNSKGSVSSIYDKSLNRELIDRNCSYGCNEFVYTDDNHKSFHTPETARFSIITEYGQTTVISVMNEEQSGAEIIQKVTVHSNEKRIDFDNSLNHVKALYNNNRYYRYCYYAFPFNVEKGRRFCHLNGCMAEYANDVTGHGTDVYMAAHEWCCVENGNFGIALMQLDSELVEFDHIHPDKTDYARAGDGSHIYSYFANDWLQMHSPGGSHMNFHMRYSITSYEGGYKNAGIFKMAERYTNPLLTAEIKRQSGSLPSEKSFMAVDDENLRLLTLKRAENGEGEVARFYTNDHPAGAKFKIDFNGLNAKRVGTDEETPINVDEKVNGFLTIRLGEGKVNIPVREEIAVSQNPMPIGSKYTGLISTPRAASGEESGHLYLLWGANTEPGFSHYELYRSEKSGFIPSDETFLAKVMPEEYVVGRYVDKNLKEHTTYYYRVRAVNDKNEYGEFSEEFSGITKETII
ncbi:MAG: glycoside hydrolase family 38 C-terminal domain-containing protein [Monoglobales bacterium]